MAIFLVRDYDNPRGFIEREVVGVLPRTATESYVPWALTPAQRVVYAKYGEHRSWPNKGGLIRYDMLTSQNRRRLCESEYGNFALTNRVFTQTAVNKVSQGIHHYLTGKWGQDRQRALDIFCDPKKGIAHYMFSDGGSFGRMGGVGDRPSDKQAIWDMAIAALSTGSLQQVLALHDGIGRKILPELGGGEVAVYESWGTTVRPDELFDPKVRGRVPTAAEKAGTVPLTRQAGIAAVGTGRGMAQVDQARKRGVDMFQRAPDATTPYYQDLDTRNLLFGAGPSGTTGTLLQAAFTFGKLSKGSDLVKEYVMAIIGYLVGGGMHSFHETMVVANRVGVPYEPGAFIKSLPREFSQSSQFRSWNVDYYDIVTLGATHWLYNKQDGASAQTATHH